MNEPEQNTQKRSSGLASLPSTSIGRWSAWLLLIAVALILLNNLVVMPETEQRTGLELAQQLFNLAAGLCIVFAGVTSLLAIVKKRERSWVLMLSVLLLVFALAFNLGPIILE